MQKIKVLFLTNNENTLDLYEWLSGFEDVECFLFREKLSIDYLTEINTNLIVSFGYRYIIKSDVIELYKGKIINLHISYLPWNKGADPNIWSFLENTPKGVTIHLIDEGIDTGDILYQKEIIFDEETETLSSSYEKLQREIKLLFKQKWNDIKSFRFIAQKQIERGTFHYSNDFKKIKFILGEKGWNISIVELKKNYKKILFNNEKKDL